MGLPSSEERARTIMDRSIQNLEIVNRLRSDRLASGVDVEREGPHEVTQLINSFLGALIQPWEEIREDDRLGEALREPLTRLRQRNLNWPIPETELAEDQEPRTYFRLLSLMRNAFAHGNLDLIGSGTDIDRVRLWNECNCGSRTWGTSLSVRELEDFLYFFQDLAYKRLDNKRPWIRGD